MKENLILEIEEQHERNIKNWGKQPMGTLILELFDQTGKLRDAFLHRTGNQVYRRMVNIGSLLWAMDGMIIEAEKRVDAKLAKGGPGTGMRTGETQDMARERMIAEEMHWQGA